MPEIPAGWRKTRFDELAFHISDRVDDPKEAGVGVYVGLEHLDPGSLKIKRRGTPDDVNATKLRVKPGQIIFGKRRAYQRKVALADFDGICSAHAMVLAANPETTAPNFLPFFMQSDIFFERAIAISEGSLSPTIKWKTLAAQEFLIPPIARQKELVELFQAIEDAIAATEESIAAAEQLKRSLLHELMTKGIGHTEFKRTKIGEMPEEWQLQTVEKVCHKVIDCKNRTPPETKRGYAVIRTTNIRNGKFIFSGLKFTDANSYEIWTQRGKPKSGDILITREAPVGEVALLPESLGSACLGQRMMLLRPIEEILDNTFMLYALLSQPVWRYLLLKAGGSTVGHVRVNDIQTLPIPIPPLEEQLKIALILKKSDLQGETLATHHVELESLKRQLINDLLFNQQDVTLIESARELVGA